MTDSRQTKQIWIPPHLIELDDEPADIANGFGGVPDGTAGRTITS